MVKGTGSPHGKEQVFLSCRLQGESATNVLGGKKLSEHSLCRNCHCRVPATWKQGPGCMRLYQHCHYLQLKKKPHHYFQGDSGQTFHLKTVILQMFNYFANAKDDCKFVICLVRSYQPQPPRVTGKKNIVHRKLKWFNHFKFKMILLYSLGLCSLISSLAPGRVPILSPMTTNGFSFSLLYFIPGTQDLLYFWLHS